MFEHMYRHTGMLNNTGKNVVVVFMQLPEDSDHALVIDTDSLPDMYNEALRRVVESTDAQQAKNLYEVLARRPSPDGSNMTMLARFHETGRLMKTPVSNVTMVPRRGVRWPLSDVLQAMKSQETMPQGFDDLDPETKAEVAANIKKFNVHNVNQENEALEGNKSHAASLLEMARLLEADAQAKRETAYRMDPSLKPSAKKQANLVVEPMTASVPVETVVVKTEPAVKPRRPIRANKAA